MKRGIAYRIIAITLAFLFLGAAILVPLGTNAKDTLPLWIAAGVIGAAYITAIAWSLIDYGKCKESDRTK